MKRNAAALVLQRFYFQWGAQERREIESGTESGDAKRYALGAIELPDVPPKKADDGADEPQQNANGSEGEINEEDSFEDDDGDLVGFLEESGSILALAAKIGIC